MADDNGRTYGGYTLHFPPELAEWVRSFMRDHDLNFGEAVSEMLEGTRTWWVPPVARKSLEADSSALGMPMRKYIKFVLTTRFAQVRAKGPGFDRERIAATQK